MYEADTDQDGYEDGVEVESGYDPLIPAPGDKIGVNNEGSAAFIEAENALGGLEENLTAKTIFGIQDTAENLKEEGKEEFTAEDAESSIQTVIEEELKNTEITEIDVERIKLKVVDYTDKSEEEIKVIKQNNALEYFTALSYVTKRSFPNGFFDEGVEKIGADFIEQAAVFTQKMDDFTFFEDMADSALDMQEEIYKMAVTEELLEVHVKMLQLLEYAKDVKIDGGYKKISTDPLAFAVAMSKMQYLLLYAEEYYEELDKILNEYDLVNKVNL